LKWPSLKAKIGKTKESKFGRIDSTGANPTKLFFSLNVNFFLFVAIKLGRFIVHALFSYVTNTQA
jgi:hypothetical protein